MTDPYIRAAEHFPELKAQAIAKLEKRRVGTDGAVWVRARNADGTFVADDPITPEDEAWVLNQGG